MGQTTETLGTTHGHLPAIGEARLNIPLHSAIEHRRYSRYQLRTSFLDLVFRDAGPAGRLDRRSAVEEFTRSGEHSASTPTTAASPRRRATVLSRWSVEDLEAVALAVDNEGSGEAVEQVVGRRRESFSVDYREGGESGSPGTVNQ